MDRTTTERRTPRRAKRPGVALTTGIGLAATSALLTPAAMAGSSAALADAPRLTTDATSSQAVSALTAAALEARAGAATRSDRSTTRGPVTDTSSEPVEAVEALEAVEVEEEPEIVGKRYASDDVNVRTKPDMDSDVVTVLDRGTKIKITDVTDGDFRQIVYKDELRWVKKDFLSKSKPEPVPSGPSSAACASGSGVESGLDGNAIAVHRAVCNAFPTITSYGGTRGGGGNHGSGHALDIMVSGGTGDAVANYVRGHAAELGVSEVIFSQRIWTVQRASEGWRGMSDRGSATANHYDHVHVSVY